MTLEKYSFGIGDRFGRQGKAQLAAVRMARKDGVNVTPVWNKSNREHTIIGTTPADVRKEADDAVAECAWEGPYFVDADHVGLDNVDRFIEASDSERDIDAFVRKHNKYVGRVDIEGIDKSFDITEEQLRTTAGKFLQATKQAGTIYRHIEKLKGAGSFITEVSMDETDEPQTPVEMLFILAAIADEGIPARTVAPKFTGRFNKGVDYVGDVTGFSKEFEEDLAIVAFAVREFGLPENLKLSVHSGSDKFSIYGPISRALKKFDAGLHVKTAGTTWLEELTGLAMAGGDGLEMAKQVYAGALSRIDELCGPYATVIDIDKGKLPAVEVVNGWQAEMFASALRHDLSCRDYNPSFRQLLHVGYKVAAEMGRAYLDALDKHAEIIAQNVTQNIYERHIRPLFTGRGV
jgi:hypothetical protein